MNHDDGNLLEDIEKSDIVLLELAEQAKLQHQFILPTKVLKLQIFHL